MKPTQETGLTLANASQHLQVLRAARLIEAEKEGLYVKYRLADQMVCQFFRSMRLVDFIQPDEFLNRMVSLKFLIGIRQHEISNSGY